MDKNVISPTNINFTRLIMKRARSLDLPRDTVRDLRENLMRYKNDELRAFIDELTQPADKRVRYFNEDSELAHYSLVIETFNQARITELNIALRFRRP